VREGIRADDGLVRLDGDARELADQAAERIDTRRIHARGHPIVVLPGPQGHHDLFQGSVPGTLADAIDGALDLPRTAEDARQRIGGGHPQVVVAVHGNGRFLYAANVLHDASDQAAPFPW